MHPYKTRRVPLPSLFSDSVRRSHAQRLRCHFSFQLALRYGARSPRLLDQALREAEEAENDHSKLGTDDTGLDR